MSQILTDQDFANAKRDISDIDKAVNTESIVDPRWGGDFKSLPMVSKEWDAKTQEAQNSITLWQDAINTIIAEDGVPALAVSTATGSNQQAVNDLGGVDYWAARAYQLNNEVRLDDGTVVFSTTNNNSNNPNSDMTGWKKKNSADQIFDESGLSQQAINNRLKNLIVFPEHFDNDIITAANYAAEKGGLLFTANKTYNVSDEFVVPENTVWLSNNTTLLQTGAALAANDKSVIAPRSNVRIIGTLTLDMGAPATGWGEKAHCRIDSFRNRTAQVKGFYFDTLILKGGYENCNGFVMAGGASLVRGKRIECGDTSKIGRIFMAHWGNFTDHYNSAGTYYHKPDWLPTTHPHDCIIDEVVVGDMTTTSADVCSVACVSAGYDIEIKNIKGNMLNSANTDTGLVVFTAGDLAFAYATAEEKAHGMKGNKIGKINGKTYAYGLNFVPWALYGANDNYTNVSVIPTYDDYLAKIELDVDYLNAVGDYTRNVASNILLSGRTGKGRLAVGVAIGEKFYSSFTARNLSNNVTIDKLISKDTKLNSVVIDGTGTTANVLPSHIRIKELVTYKYGMTSSNAAYRSAVSNKLSKDVFIDKITVQEHGNAAIVADTSNGTLGSSFAIGHIQINDPAYTIANLITNTNLVTDPIQLNSYSVASNSVTLAVNGGVCYSQSGGMNKVYYSTPISSVGLPLKANDYLNMVNVAGGATNKYRVVTSGLYGSTAVVEKIESRTSSISLATQTLAAGASVKVRSALSLSGLLVTDKLEVNANITLQGCFLYADITAAGVFDVYMYNPTSASVTTTAGTLYFKIV